MRLLVAMKKNLKAMGRATLWLFGTYFLVYVAFVFLMIDALGHMYIDFLYARIGQVFADLGAVAGWLYVIYILRSYAKAQEENEAKDLILKEALLAFHNERQEVTRLTQRVHQFQQKNQELVKANRLGFPRPDLAMPTNPNDYLPSRMNSEECHLGTCGHPYHIT